MMPRRAAVVIVGCEGHADTVPESLRDGKHLEITHRRLLRDRGSEFLACVRLRFTGLTRLYVEDNLPAIQGSQSRGNPVGLRFDRPTEVRGEHTARLGQTVLRTPSEELRVLKEPIS
jgi:hypothetical protein